jgi:hypothetical protein
MNHRSLALSSTLIISILFITLVLGLAQQGLAEEDDAEALEYAPQWLSSPPGQLLSTNSPAGADNASVAYSPDGSQMMVVYSYRVTGPGDRDPYYRIFDGQNWTPPASIASTAGTDSAQLAVTYDAQNNAHVVWEEPEVGLLYRRYNGSNWSPPQLIISTTLRIFGTSITASGGQRVDVVWGSRPSEISNPNIYHARSTNGGNSWSDPEPVAVTNPPSRSPKVIGENSGRLHLVWQERTLDGHEILYAQGPNWTTPVAITPPSVPDATQPSIVRSGGTLHVAFARYEAVNAQTSNQWAYYTGCQNNCTNAGSWSNAINISGQAVRVNESAPFNLISDIVSHGNCVYVFFHGYIPAVSSNEVIWDVNSCDGWSSGGRDQVTGFGMRGIYPRVVVHDNTIRVVYEWVEGSQHQIYTIEGLFTTDPGNGGPSSGLVYLPMIQTR